MNTRQLSSLAGFADFSNLALFSGGTPNALKVKQGQTGNCGFIASLIAVCFKSPDLIQDLICWSEDGRITCKFFSQGQWTQMKTQPIFPVDRRSRSLVSECVDGGLWVSSIEKTSCMLFNNGSYEDACSNPLTDLYHLAGWLPERLHVNDHTLQLLTRSCSQSMYVACIGTSESLGKDTSYINGEEVCPINGLIRNHCYSVLGICSKSRTVMLRNPWMSHEGRFGQSGSSCGCFRVSFQDLLTYFEYFYVVWDPTEYRLIASKSLSSAHNEEPLEIFTDEQTEILILLSRHYHKYATLQQSYCGLSVVDINGQLVEATSLKNSETVSLRLTLEPGRYIVQTTAFTENASSGVSGRLEVYRHKPI